METLDEALIKYILAVKTVFGMVIVYCVARIYLPLSNIAEYYNSPDSIFIY